MRGDLGAAITASLPVQRSPLLRSCFALLDLTQLFAMQECIFTRNLLKLNRERE